MAAAESALHRARRGGDTVHRGCGILELMVFCRCEQEDAVGTRGTGPRLGSGGGRVGGGDGGIPVWGVDCWGAILCKFSRMGRVGAAERGFGVQAGATFCGGRVHSSQLGRRWQYCTADVPRRAAGISGMRFSKRVDLNSISSTEWVVALIVEFSFRVRWGCTF